MFNHKPLRSILFQLRTNPQRRSELLRRPGTSAGLTTSPSTPMLRSSLPTGASGLVGTSMADVEATKPSVRGRKQARPQTSQVGLFSRLGCRCRCCRLVSLQFCSCMLAGRCSYLFQPALCLPPASLPCCFCFSTVGVGIWWSCSPPWGAFQELISCDHRQRAIIEPYITREWIRAPHRWCYKNPV